MAKRKERTFPVMSEREYWNYRAMKEKTEGRGLNLDSFDDLEFKKELLRNVGVGRLRVGKGVTADLDNCKPTRVASAFKDHYHLACKRLCQQYSIKK